MGQNILIPVDGSPHSEKALEYVLEELPEPTITLLHVINPVSVLAYSDKDGRFDVDAYQRERGDYHDDDDGIRERFRGQTLATLELEERTGMTIMAIRRANDWILSPTGETTLQSGDMLIARGPKEGSRLLREQAID